VTPLSPVLRVATALPLLLFALVEALRLLALAAAPMFPHVLVEHGALALLAGLAGYSLLGGAAWAPAAILAFGAVLAAIHLLDAIVFGIRPWLFALLTAVAALAIACLLAASVRHGRRGLT